MDEHWPLETLIVVLDRSMLMGGPIGFGPILPTGTNLTEYHASVRFWGPTHSDMYPRLKHVWDRLVALETALKAEKVP